MIKDLRESCETCDKRFARKDELDQHKKIEHHNGAKKKKLSMLILWQIFSENLTCQKTQEKKTH